MAAESGNVTEDFIDLPDFADEAVQARFRQDAEHDVDAAQRRRVRAAHRDPAAAAPAAG